MTQTEDIKLPLKKFDKRELGENVTHWVSSKPFVRNCSGQLTHRPKYAYSQKMSFGALWFHVGYWCGAQANGAKKLSFIDKPDESEPLCPKCEAMALKNGYPSADLVVGSSVYISNTKDHGNMLFKRALAREAALKEKQNEA